MISKMNFTKIIVLFLSASLLAHSQNVALKAPANWQNLDYQADKVYGISTEKAYEYLKNKPRKKVIVAIIDSGVEIDHPDLQQAIWTNEKEIAGNGLDDDQNGYVDDLHGWDFLGNKNGEDIAYESLELVREMVKYRNMIAKYPANNLNATQQEHVNTYKALKEKFESKKKEIDPELANYYIQIHDSYQAAKQLIEKTYGKVPIDDALLKQISLISSPALQDAKQFFMALKEINMSPDDLEEAYEYFYSNTRFNLNEDYNPRPIIGDDPTNLEEHNYGNNEVEGPNAGHGTHVAGIIAAQRNNDLGIKGVADNAALMIIRAVPDGDERDKDIANAIRYAVDNGAQVINMSFGKGYSPNKELVDAAVAYAESKNVLLVHAAGNDALNLDKEDNFPNAKFKISKKTCSSWIEVGASTYKEAPNLVASFSNYGQRSVDVFAPGLDIYATVPNAKYKENSGTSMAAPVVSGLAALLMGAYPHLTAVQVKEVILKSAIKLQDTKVKLPESEDIVKFGALSKTAGIVNAYEAVKLASSMN